MLNKHPCVLAVLPTSTSCEDSYNAMNILKDGLRSSLHIENLNEIAMINVNDPNLEDMNPVRPSSVTKVLSYNGPKAYLWHQWDIKALMNSP